MKKVLFIISNMESGGVSKSMSSLLNIIDTSRYEVDCFVLSPQGIFMETIPKGINLITDTKTQAFFAPFPQCIFQLIKKGYWKDVFYRLLAAFCMIFNKGWGGWILSRRIAVIEKHYDVAVDYNGQHQLYYLIDKVQANVKITFFHSDYGKWSYYYDMDKKYMPKVDFIFTVSDKCVQSMRNYFPDEAHKIDVFENISPIRLIQSLALTKVEDSLDSKSLKLITIGHLCERKGTSLAIRAAGILKQRGIVFKWYFLGNDKEKSHYDKLAVQEGVTDNIVFMGVRANPYPYIKQADIVVHPSQFEGKSIALDEAKILCKPIVVTNFSTVNDQFANRVSASICDMTPEDLSQKIIELANNHTLRREYIGYLENNIHSNEMEIERLYSIIDAV